MFGKNKDLDFDLSDLDYLEDERDRHLLIVEVCTRIGQHSKQFDHALVFHSLPSNNAVDEVAFFLTHNEVSLKDIKRPVVVICAYAFGRNFGATMFLNDAAADLFGKELLPAASDMFISLKRYKELQAAQPALYVGIPNNGQIVPHPDKDVRDKWVHFILLQLIQKTHCPRFDTGTTSCSRTSTRSKTGFTSSSVQTTNACAYLARSRSACELSFR